MLIAVRSSKFASAIKTIAAYSLLFSASPQPVWSSSSPPTRSAVAAQANGHTTVLRLKPGEDAASAFGLRISRTRKLALNVTEADPAALISCDSDGGGASARLVYNVTADCSSYSIIARGNISVEFPFDLEKIPDGVSERAVQLFKLALDASEIVSPLEFYLDRENKTTVATLENEGGRFINGVLKRGDQTERMPEGFEPDGMARLKEANGFGHVPIIARPTPSQTGELRLSYPLAFPGTRDGLTPSVSIDYRSTSGYGQLGDGWSLTAPTISVDTRWGVPVFDPNYETESYLYNGEQLVAERTENNQDVGIVYLADQPHRAKVLAKRQSRVSFVLRRDSGSLHLVRHGSSPDAYWWEGWQETGGNQKIMFFGKAPGRRYPYLSDPGDPADIERGGVRNPDDPEDQVQRELALLRGPSSRGQASLPGLPRPDRAQMRWVIGRESDSFGNTIDYEWQSDCILAQGSRQSEPDVKDNCSNIKPANIPAAVFANDLYLRRITYGSSSKIDQDIEACRISDDPFCKKQLALYEIIFKWSGLTQADYARSEARGGGLVVAGRRLDQMTTRLRRNNSDTLAKLEWLCSAPFVAHRFIYRLDDLVSSSTGGKYLLAQVRTTFSDSDVIPTSVRDQGGVMVPASFTHTLGSCAEPALLGVPDDKVQAGPNLAVTRFEYDGSEFLGPKTSFTLDAGDKLAAAGLPPATGAIRDLFSAGGKKNGPFAATAGGSVGTSEVAGSIFLGIGFGSEKRFALGVKGGFNRRLAYSEMSTLVDLTGDGIPDLVTKGWNGGFEVHVGKIDTSDGQLSFDNAAADTSGMADIPALHQEPQYSSDNVAVEAHFPRGYAAGFRSWTQGVQDVFLVDMDGDKKLDVVVGGKIYYNRSKMENGKARIVFTANPSDPLLGFRAVDSNGASSIQDQTLLPLAKNDVKTAIIAQNRAPKSIDYPRLNTVRAWRAPFGGQVRIAGSVELSRPKELAPVDNEDKRSPEQKKEAARIDGVIVSVQRSTTTAAGQPHVELCAQGPLVLTEASRTSTDTLPQKVTLTLKGPSNCLDVSKGEPSPPATLVAPDDLVLTVAPGDVIYFAVDPVDNGSADIVDWNPRVDYLRLYESIFDSSSSSLVRRVIYGYDQVNDVPALDAVKVLMSRLSTQCAQSADVPIVRSGSAEMASEQALGLCDRWGRSIVRFVPAEEQNDLAVSVGSTLAPYSGRFSIEGVVRKPATLFGARLVMQLRHRASDGHVKPCNSRDEADSRIIAEFSAEEDAKDLSKDPYNKLDWPVAVERGALVCMFWISTEPRIFSDRFTIGAGAWPEDLSTVVWDTPLQLAYRSKLLVTTDPTNALPAKGDTLAPGSTDAEKLRVCIDPGSEPSHLPTPLGALAAVLDADGVSHPYLFVCFETADRFAVMPKIPVAYDRSVADDNDPAVSARVDRPVLRALPVSLPETNAACSMNGEPSGKFSYRFQINPTTLPVTRPPGEVPSDVLLGSLVTAFVPRKSSKAEDRRPELIATFKVVSRATGNAVPLRPEHFLGKLAPEERFAFDKRTKAQGGFETKRSLVSEHLLEKTSSNGLMRATVRFDEFLAGPSAEEATDVIGFHVCSYQPAVVHIDASSLFFRLSEVQDRDLIAALTSDTKLDEPIYLSPMSGVSEQRVAQIRNLLSAAGYRNIAASKDLSVSGMDIETTFRPVAQLIPPSTSAPTQMAGGFSVEVMRRESLAFLDAKDCGPLQSGLFAVCPLTKSVVLTSKFDGVQDTSQTPVRLIESSHHISAPRVEWASPQSTRGWSNLALDTEYDLGAPTTPEPKSLPLPTPGAVLLPDYKTVLNSISDAGSKLSADGQVRSACGALGTSPGSPPDPSTAGDCAQSSHYKALVAMRAFPLVPQWRQPSGRGENEACIANGQRRVVADPSGLDRAFGSLPSIVPMGRMRAFMGESDASPQPHNGQPGGPSKYSCSIGPDPEVWVSGTRVSASRLGAKDVADRLAELAAETAEVIYPSAQVGGAPTTTVAAVTQIALPKSSSYTTSGYSVGADPALLSESSTTVSSGRETIDLNGDGYPDQVSGQSILLTDPLGNYRCVDSRTDTWSGAGGLCKQPWTNSNQARTSDVEALQVTPFTSSKSATVSQAAPNATNGSGTTGAPIRQAVRQGEPHFGPQPPAIMFGDSASVRRLDWIDINGDGLPDRIGTSCAISAARSENCDLSVEFNVGYVFAPSQNLGPAPIERSLSVGLNVGAGFSDGDDRNEYAGGINASLSASKAGVALVDVNGDGLPDLVAPRVGTACDPATIRSFPTQLCARFNVGRSFTDWKPLANASIPLLGSGGLETDNLSGGAWFTIAFGPLLPTPLFILVNPGAGITETTSRQVMQLKDMDGDGLPEMVVGGGLSNGQFRLDFDNSKSQVFHNNLGRRSLLSRVFLPTNPQETNLAANYEFSFARSGNNDGDPGSHWVLSEIVVRDGVVQDDQLSTPGEKDSNIRRTCIAYGDGYFDRYEKRFQGFAKVRVVEGCETPVAGRPLLQQLDAAGETEPLVGRRRIDQSFGNRSVFDAGLLLKEAITVADSSLKWESLARRETKNHYVLVDLRARHPDRFKCYSTSTARDGGPMATNSTLEAAKTILQNVEGSCATLPELDPLARRLAPFLVEVVKVNREANSGGAEIKSVVRLRPDFRGRVVRACDFGDPDDPTDDVCSQIDYYDSLASDGTVQNQLQVLIHYNRLLGDEVTSTPQFGLARNLVIRSSRAILRRRTALYNLDNGQVLRICRFLNPTTPIDPCDPVMAHSQQPPPGIDFPSIEMLFPTEAKELFVSNKADVAMDVFAYDTRGNLAWTLSPISGFSPDANNPGGSHHYLSKRWTYDTLLQRVGRSETAVICAIDPAARPSVPMADRDWSNLPCLPGSASVKNVSLPNSEGTRPPFGEQFVDAKQLKPAVELDASSLGSLTAYTLGVDYRFAVSTVSIDVNSNAIYRPLDPFGRPKATSATFGDVGQQMSPPRELKEVKKGAIFRQLASYEYRHWGIHSDANGGHSGPVLRITLSADPNVYRSRPDGAGKADPTRPLITDVLFDQLGTEIQKQSDDENCRSFNDAVQLDRCQWYGATITASIIRDGLGRPVARLMPVASERSASLAAIRYLSPSPLGNAALSPRTIVEYDGLDRPTLVQHPDGNSYQISYWVDQRKFADGTRTVHRTVATNAVCTPMAVERNARGYVRAVEEYWQDDATKASGSIDAQALGSSVDVSNLKAALGGGWLKTVTWDQQKRQQVSECHPIKAIALSLQPGKTIGNAKIRSVRTEYQYDPLGNAVAVLLPPKADVPGPRRPPPPIRIGYDLFGRRVWTNDPDRGFEAQSLDLTGNALCRRSGPQLKLDSASDPDGYWLDRNCEQPKIPSSVHRIVKSEFLFNRLARITYPFVREGLASDGQAIVLQYAPANDEMKDLNLVGRLARIDDLTGVEVRAYDATGHRTITAKRFRDLKAGGKSIAELVVNDEYDVWSSLKRKSVKGFAAAIDGNARRADFSERIDYRYTVGGRLASVSTANSALPDGSLKVLVDARYDERGNAIYSEIGNSVKILRTYDDATNRLLKLNSRLPSKSCRESSTGDDCSSFPPGIDFQSVSYGYDALGNTLRADNSPVYAAPCRPPGGDGLNCAAILDANAREWGLLVKNNVGSFAYDQLNRVRSAEHQMSVYSRQKKLEMEATWSPDDLTKASSRAFSFKEQIAYANTHEVREIGRSMITSGGARTTDKSNSSLIFTFGSRPEHSPTSASQTGGHSWGFEYDYFGRQKSRTVDDRHTTFQWQADDSLANVSAELPISEREQKQGIKDKRSIVAFRQNMEGGRVIKASSRRTEFRDGRTTDTPLGDTLYLADVLTVSRLPNKTPDVMVHLSAGPDRLASYWVGEQALISYHPILRNQSVNDVVVGDARRPETARIFQQLEYSSFGEVIHSRTALAEPDQTGATEKRAMRAPRWRFDSKEADTETGLTYFGARYYDPALAIWLSPDPKFPVGASNKAAASSQQLASYSFAAQNPISKIDPRGRAPQEAESSRSSIFGSRADELYYTDDHWIVFTPRIDLFWFFGASGEVGSAGDVERNAGGYGFKGVSWGAEGAKPGWEKVGSYDVVGKALDFIPLPKAVQLRPSVSGIVAVDDEGMMLGVGMGGAMDVQLSGVKYLNKVPYLNKAKFHSGAEGFALIGDGRVAVGGLAHGELGPFAVGGGADVENKTEWGGKSLRAFDRWNREILRGIGQLMGPNLGDNP